MAVAFPRLAVSVSSIAVIFAQFCYCCIGARRTDWGASSKQRLILGNIELINHLVVCSRLSNCQLLSVQLHQRGGDYVAIVPGALSTKLPGLLSFTVLLASTTYGPSYYSAREGFEPTPPGLHF